MNGQRPKDEFVGTEDEVIDRAGVRPPEDVGGSSGFEHFLAVMADSRHEEHVNYVRWHGGNYEPKAFSLYDTNGRIQCRN